MMSTLHKSMLAANEAMVTVSFRASEIIAIYPITPASGMAKICGK